MLLPVDGHSAGGGEEPAVRTRAELVERFGGITAYVQTPALGEWTASGGTRERDRVVMIEVVAAEFDRAWWRSYADTLSDRFRQDAIHVRAMRVEVLDPEAV